MGNSCGREGNSTAQEGGDTSSNGGGQLRSASEIHGLTGAPMEGNTMGPENQYRLKWSSFGTNLTKSFADLYENESLTDVTLFCEGEYLIFKNKFSK